MVEYFKKALLGIGKVHVSNSVFTYPMRIADAYFISPMIYDEQYIDTLFDYAKQNSISVIISLFDIDLPILAKNKNRFKENGISLIVSDIDVIDICNDKWKTYNFLIKYSLPVPVTCLSIKSAIELIESEKLSFPLIIKPRWGMGSIGIHFANNSSELQILYTKTKEEIAKSYLRFESAIDLENSIIIQQALSGDEYGLDVFNNLNTEYITCVPKQKLQMRAGETDSAVTINDPLLISLGKQLAIHLKHIGNLDVDLFKTDDGYKILELNCRFGGQYPFSHLAGVDFPKAIITMLQNYPINDVLITYKTGVIGSKELNPVVLNTI